MTNAKIATPQDTVPASMQIAKATHSSNFSLLFFSGSTAAVIALLSAVPYLPDVLVPHAASASPDLPDYRLTITAMRLPIECRVAGAMQGTQFCDRFLNRGVVESNERVVQ